MLKWRVALAAFFLCLPATAHAQHCGVHRVENYFADGALIYEYTAANENLRLFRATCRGGEVYVRMEWADREPVEMRVIEPSMPAAVEDAPRTGDNRRERFSVFAVPRTRYTVYEYGDGSRSIERLGPDSRGTAIGSSQIRRRPGDARVGERIGQATIVRPPPTPLPPPPSPELLAPIASDDPANWQDAPFMQPDLDPSVLAGYHPARARERDHEGSVTLGVVIGPDGGAENIVLLSQTSPGWNFELAAAAIARQAHWPTTAPDGRAAPYRIRMSVHFRLR